MSRKTIIALAVLFGIFYLTGIMWGMPSEFVSEIDSEFPSGPFNILAHLSDRGYISNYPVFHKLLMLPLYAAIIVMFRITGQLSFLGTAWPYGFNDPVASLTAMIVAARSVSLFMGAGTIFVLGLMVNRLSEKQSVKKRLLILSPVAAFGLSGVIAYYSRVSNYDAPQLFWWALSFYFLWKSIDETAGRKKEIILSALFAACAVATKDQTFFFIAGSSLLLLFFPQNEKKSGWRINNFLAFSFYAACFYFAAAVLVQPFHWWNHLNQVLLLNITSGRFAVYPGSFSGQAGLLVEAFRCLSHVISPFGIILGTAGLVTVMIKKEWTVLAFIGFPLLASYILIFARIHFVFERYMLNYAFLFALAAAYGLRLVLDTPSVRRLKYVPSALSVIMGCWLLYQLVFSFVPVTCAQVRDTKRQLSAVLPSFVRAGDTIGWQGARFSLPNAKTYSRYRFAIPDSVYDSLHSSRMTQVFVRSKKKRTWVLSDRDLFSCDSGLPEIARRNWIDTSGLVLMARVEDPEFIQKNINVYSVAHRLMTFRVSIPYYLYKRNL